MATEVLHEINCPKMGNVKVYVRGVRSQNETIILTVHDLGCNHSQYDQFIEHPAMEQITQRCTYVHVELPGQADYAQDFSGNYEFPTFQEIAEDISFIMNALSIDHAVLFGEGAGANILARLAMNETHRIFGAILVHCSGSSASMMESMRDMVKGSKADQSQFLVEHRFGLYVKKSSMLLADIRDNVHNFKVSLKTTRNTKNLNKFINAFMNRSSIVEKANLLTCPMLLITASLSVQRCAAQAFFTTLQKLAREEPEKRRRIDFVQVDGCANPLLQRADKLAESIQYFLQGLGLVSGVVSRKISGSVPMKTSDITSSVPRDDGYEDCGPNLIVRDSRVGSDPYRKLSSSSPGRRISMGEADVHKSPQDVVFNPNRKYSSIVPPPTVQEH